MNPTARRLLGAAAHAVARKLLPESVSDYPGSRLALPAPDRALMAPRSTNPFPTVRTSPAVYVPPPAPVPVAAPAPAPRRRSVTITEIYYEETEW